MSSLHSPSAISRSLGESDLVFAVEDEVEETELCTEGDEESDEVVDAVAAEAFNSSTS
jgi:hypothetical protein